MVTCSWMLGHVVTVAVLAVTTCSWSLKCVFPAVTSHCAASLRAIVVNHIIRNTNIHEHNTRRHSNLHIYRTQHTFAGHCLRHDLPNTLNNTCELVKGKIYTHSLSGFTNYAKHQIIQNYELTCHITRCYICSHDVR